MANLSVVNKTVSGTAIEVKYKSTDVPPVISSGTVILLAIEVKVAPLYLVDSFSKIFKYMSRGRLVRFPNTNLIFRTATCQ